MAIIKVPRTPAKAFNTERPASDLLRRQIQHLEWAKRPASERTATMLKKAPRLTEGEAAERIHTLTVQVIEQARRDADAAATPVAIRATPPARRPRPKRTRASRRAAHKARKRR